LSKEIQIDELLVLFEQFGEIRACAIQWEKGNTKSVGACIEYRTKDNAQKAFNEYDGAELDSKIIGIKIIG